MCDLLEATEARGHHATGIAACGGDDPFVWKVAAPARKVVRSDAFQTEALKRITDRTTIVLGHTRWATHPNAHENEAAHPFVQGQVVGAHNGVIYNWRELNEKLFTQQTWKVDSQAAFALLDKAENPAKALEQLEGYFALTWMKKNRLFLARSREAPLACAYVPALRTLFWNSEKGVLEHVLRKAGIKEFESWETRPNVIYRYKPRSFGTSGTGVERHEVQFESYKKSKAAGPGMPTTFGGGLSYWDAIEAREVVRRTSRKLLRPVETSTAQLTLREANEQIAKLQGDVESLREELQYLFRVLDEHGLLQKFEEDAPPQPELPLISCAVCQQAGETSETGPLLAGLTGHVHENCLFRDATTA